MKVKASLVKVSDVQLIKRLAGWYLKKWGILEDITISRLSSYPNEFVLVQLVLKEGNRVFATGGLYHTTGLSIIFPEYKALSPWIALLYTDAAYRGKGYGALLLQSLEEYASSVGITQVFLFTSTAEKLYKRSGYRQIERVKYKGADTVVMEKFLKGDSPTPLLQPGSLSELSLSESKLLTLQFNYSIIYQLLSFLFFELPLHLSYSQRRAIRAPAWWTKNVH